jgi:hypothetical protein
VRQDAPQQPRRQSSVVPVRLQAEFQPEFLELDFQILSLDF